MAGEWHTGDTDSDFEEHWMKPSGGVMIGMGRRVAGGKLEFYEYLRLEKTSEGIIYVAQPFGKTTTRFRLTKLDSTAAVFENALHDFPSKIVYERRRNGALTVRLTGKEQEPSTFILHREHP